MKNPISWFEIYVDNMDRACAFYATMLDVEFTDLLDPSETSLRMKAFPSQMDAYGASGALVYMADMPAGQNSVLVYFACDDCAVEEARIEGAGGTVIRPKFAIGDYGFVTLAKDTEGNMFGLHSMA